mgnify:CR=1 FL=1
MDRRTFQIGLLAGIVAAKRFCRDQEVERMIVRQYDVGAPRRG